MKVGFVGCGKLGLMVALTIESRGHEVRGFDVRPEPGQYLKSRTIPFQEEHAAELLQSTKMTMCSLQELCEWAEIIFIAVQTPHAEQYDGTHPLPDDRADFNYLYLRNAVRAVNKNLKEPKTCVIISTVLPGTIEREILPLTGVNFRLVYSPQFIAMGTVYRDFLNPEFWLIGTDIPAGLAIYLFQAINSQVPVLLTDIRTAEGIKVFYNTFITTKTVLANLYGEMAERLGMNVDDIFKAVSCSTRRLLSTRYLAAGMGDGGGCHPRDNIALSHCARKCGLSFDFFEALMTARERHCEFLADIIELHFERCGYPLVILGRAFKPETNIETGSPSLLLSRILKDRGYPHECVEDWPTHQNRHPHLFFIGCKHSRYDEYKFPLHSIVIDPFRYIRSRQGITVIRIGEGRHGDLERAEYRQENKAFA